MQKLVFEVQNLLFLQSLKDHQLATLYSDIYVSNPTF